MATEVISFEMRIYVDDELRGSVNDLKQQIIRALVRNIEEISDIDINCTGTERIK